MITTSRPAQNQPRTAPDGAPLCAGEAFETILARGALVLLACTAIYALLGLGIYRFWHPSGAIYHELFAATVVDSRIIHPEPQEQRFYMLVVFTCPFLLLGLWRWIARGRIARLVNRRANIIIAAATALTITLGVAGLLANNPYPNPLLPGSDTAFAVASRVNVSFYFFDTLLYNHPYLSAGVLVPLCLWLLLSQKVQGFLSVRERWCNIGILVFAATVGGWMLASETFRFPYTTENRYDFSVIYYPMVQVYHGAQLLTDHFSDTYGLYPQFLLPLFKVIGLSVTTFSATMAVLTVGCFAILLLVLWRFIANRLILLWTFAAVFFYVFCYSRTVNPFDPYYANIPIRLIPTMTALALSLYYQRETTLWRTTAALGLLGTLVLWCPDFGLISYFAFTLFIAYLHLDPGQPRRTCIALGKTLLLSLVTLAGVFAAYTLLMRLSYGTAPDFSILFGAMKVFSALGMNMMPMPLLHPWNLVVLTFAGGLLATLPPLLRGDQDERSGRLFLLTILGIGAFSYYQGRSHNWNLLPILLYAIPLWGICADRMLVHGHANRRLFFPLAVLAIALGSALPQLAYAWRPLAALVTESDNKAANLATQQSIERGADFIRRRTAPGEKVIVCTDPAWQGLYHGLAQRGTAFNPSYLDLFWRDDYKRFLTLLRHNTTTKIFLEPTAKMCFPTKIAKPVRTLLECCYYGADSDGALVELRKREDNACRSCLESEGFDLSLLQPLEH